MVQHDECIEIMLEQECSSYVTRDYMDEAHQQLIAKLMKDRDLFGDALVGPQSASTSAINEIWREKICEWSYQVVDHFEFSREVVSVAMNYLDRFLATKIVNKKVFQLAAMTSLFVAIKLLEPGRIAMSSMIELSRGYFTVEQMAAMEMALLRTLKWKVHPPTAYTFVKHILSTTTPPYLPIATRHRILELSRFLTELSVIDYYFVTHRPSDVAIAALLNALCILGGSAESLSKLFVDELARCTSIDSTRMEIADCRHRLHLLYAQGGYGQEADTNQAGAVPRNDSVSPVCVSHGVNTLCRDIVYHTITD